MSQHRTVRIRGRIRPAIGWLAALVVLAGCTPKLTPLYRDYEHASGRATTLEDTLPEIRDALEAADWTVGVAVTDNLITTEPRTFRQWGLYSVEVSLDVAPIAGPYVRVFVHPYRHYAWGARRKIPYLRRSLARSALEDLDEALRARDLANVGSAVQRDRDAERKQ